MLYNVGKDNRFYLSKEGESMEYLEKGKEILKILINNGFEAYFIGAAARNTIMSLPIDEIEITTSATPAAIKGIFEFTKVEEITEGIIKVKYYSEDYYFSTFRTPPKNRKELNQVHYSKSLRDELSCRDFTINAIAMSHSGKMTDGYNGYNDIKKKKIRLIGKASYVFQDSPISMLRAILYVSELNFKLTGKVHRGIVSNRKYLLGINPNLLADIIKAIMNGKYYRKALDLIIALKIHKYIPSLTQAFKLQYNRYRKLTIEEFLLLAFVINKEIDENYLLLVDDVASFKKVYALAIKNPKSKYDLIDLYTNGEEICLMANRINLLLKKARKHYKDVSKQYESLPIKSNDDLAFNKYEIYKLNEGLNEEYINLLVDQIVYKIIYQELNNDYDSIKVFVINTLRDKNITLTEDHTSYEYPREEAQEVDDEIVELSKRLAFNQVEEATNIEEMEEGLKNQGDVIKDYTEHRIDMLEKRLNEQERLLREKDRQITILARDTRQQKIQEDVDALVERNLELLKESDYLNKPHSDKEALSKRLHQVYMEYVNEIEDKYSYKEVKNEKD